MKQCNRRGLFGLLAAPLAALVVPVEAAMVLGGGAEKAVCEHVPIERKNDNPILRMVSTEKGTEQKFIAEFQFCKKCGVLYTTHRQEDSPPLPRDEPGINYYHTSGSVTYGSRVNYD